MKTVSVTEVQAYQLCKLKHHFQYERRLQQLSRNPLMASGTVVHEMVADRLTENQEAKPADELLSNQFPTDPYADEKVKKFLPGVLRAMDRIPPHLYTGGEWVSEKMLEYQPTPAITVRMKPDLYRVTDDTIELTEIKTTDKDPIDFLLTSPQHEWYGLGLADEYPGRVVTYEYVCIPVGERAKVPLRQQPWVFPLRRMEESKQELVEAVTEMDSGVKPAANRGWWCGSCDFKDICVTRVTGGDIEDTINSKYRERERRSN